MADHAQTPGAGERYTLPRDDHRRRIQALGAALSTRDWWAVEQAHAEIRDAFDRPDIYDPAALAAQQPKEGGAGAGEFTELDVTQAMIQAGRYAANLNDGTLARIYLAMREAECAKSSWLPPDIATRDGSYYPSDLHGPALLEWIVGYYGVNIPRGLGDKLYELAGEWREQVAAAPTQPAGGDGGGEDEPCHWGGGNDVIWCSTCGEEYAYAKGEQRPPCPRAATTPQPDDLGKLSAGATPGAWYTVDPPWGDGTIIVAGNPDPHAGTMVCNCEDMVDSRAEGDPDAADDAAFIAALVTAYRTGRLVPAPAAPLATEEPVAIPEGWALMPIKPTALMTYMGCEGIIASTKVVERLYEYMFAHRPDAPALYAAPAASRIGVSEEEIARAIHPEAFLAGSPDYYGPDISLSWNSAAQRVALGKARKVLAILAAPQARGGR